MADLKLYAVFADKSVKRVPLDRKSQVLLTKQMRNQGEKFAPGGCEVHDYAPGFRPDEGVIGVDNFKLPDSLSNLCPTEPNGLAALQEAEVVGTAAKGLVAVDAETETYFFQRVETRNYITPLRLAVFFNAGRSEVSNNPGLVLNGSLDALFEDGTLYFVSEHKVRSFLSLDALSVPAGDAQIREMLSSNRLLVADPDALVAFADTPMRRKVSAILDSGVLETVPPSKFRSAADLCKVGLSFEGNRIVVPEGKREVKELLKFLGEDILESPLREKLFEVTSKKARQAKPKTKGPRS